MALYIKRANRRQTRKGPYKAELTLSLRLNHAKPPTTAATVIPRPWSVLLTITNKWFLEHGWLDLRRREGLLPSRLNKFLEEANSLFKEGHLLFLVGRVFRLGFCHTFVSLCERSERFVIVLILVNFHLEENTTKREKWSEFYLWTKPNLITYLITLFEKKNSQSKHETKTFAAKRKKRLLANDKQGSTGNQRLARENNVRIANADGESGKSENVLSCKWWQTTCNQ